jgi:hypothetical protein
MGPYGRETVDDPAMARRRSYLDISVCHRVGVSTFFQYTHEILYAINSTLRIEFPITDNDFLKEQSRLFSRGSSPLMGCVGAIDGLAVRIAEPTSQETPNPSS